MLDLELVLFYVVQLFLIIPGSPLLIVIVGFCLKWSPFDLSGSLECVYGLLFIMGGHGRLLFLFGTLSSARSRNCSASATRSSPEINLGSRVSRRAESVSEAFALDLMLSKIGVICLANACHRFSSSGEASLNAATESLCAR